LAILVFAEPTGASFWMAAALMSAGVWFHLTEHMNMNMQSYSMATSTGTTNTTSTATISHGTVLSRIPMRINIRRLGTAKHTFLTSTTGICTGKVTPSGSTCNANERNHLSKKIAACGRISLSTNQT
jgi:hypothetical protein